MWKMIGKYTLVWRKEKWEVPLKLKNTAEFKGKVLQHILTLRSSISINDIPPIYHGDIPSACSSAANPKCLYYEQSKFEDYAACHYKIDPVAKK